MSASSILVIDDNDVDRMMVQRLLAKGAVCDSILTAEDGSKARSLCQEEAIDCILLDYELPGENGLEIFNDIKEHDAFRPVILLTGNDDSDLVAQAIRLGISDYINKSKLSLDRLQKVIAIAVENAATKRKLAQQKFELETFINRLTHDIRAPMNNAMAFAQKLRHDLEWREPSESKVSLEHLTISLRHMMDLVETLKTLASLDQEITLEPVCLRAVVDDAMFNLQQDIAAANAIIEIDKLTIVEGHRPQLIQLFENLISNALKYNRSDQPKIDINLLDQTTDLAVISIRDNGIGIEPKHYDLVFEPFKRLWSKDEFEGSGLGLAMCKSIVERHGGQISLDPATRDGAAFLVHLKPSRAATEPPTAGQSRKSLH